MGPHLSGLDELGSATAARFGRKAEGLRRLLAAGAMPPDVLRSDGEHVVVDGGAGTVARA